MGILRRLRQKGAHIHRLVGDVDDGGGSDEDDYDFSHSDDDDTEDTGARTNEKRERLKLSPTTRDKQNRYPEAADDADEGVDEENARDLLTRGSSLANSRMDSVIWGKRLHDRNRSRIRSRIITSEAIGRRVSANLKDEMNAIGVAKLNSYSMRRFTQNRLSGKKSSNGKGRNRTRNSNTRKALGGLMEEGEQENTEINMDAYANANDNVDTDTDVGVDEEIDGELKRLMEEYKKEAGQVDSTVSQMIIEAFQRLKERKRGRKGGKDGQKKKKKVTSQREGGRNAKKHARQRAPDKKRRQNQHTSNLAKTKSNAGADDNDSENNYDEVIVDDIDYVAMLRNIQARKRRASSDAGSMLDLIEIARGVEGLTDSLRSKHLVNETDIGIIRHSIIGGSMNVAREHILALLPDCKGTGMVKQQDHEHEYAHVHTNNHYDDENMNTDTQAQLHMRMQGIDVGGKRVVWKDAAGAGRGAVGGKYVCDNNIDGNINEGGRNNAGAEGKVMSTAVGHGIQSAIQSATQSAISTSVKGRTNTLSTGQRVHLSTTTDNSALHIGNNKNVHSVLSNAQGGDGRSDDDGGDGDDSSRNGSGKSNDCKTLAINDLGYFQSIRKGRAYIVNERWRTQHRDDENISSHVSNVHSVRKQRRELKVGNNRMKRSDSGEDEHEDNIDNDSNENDRSHDVEVTVVNQTPLNASLGVLATDVHPTLSVKHGLLSLEKYSPRYRIPEKQFFDHSYSSSSSLSQKSLNERTAAVNMMAYGQKKGNVTAINVQKHWLKVPVPAAPKDGIKAHFTRQRHTHAQAQENAASSTAAAGAEAKRNISTSLKAADHDMSAGGRDGQRDVAKAAMAAGTMHANARTHTSNGECTLQHQTHQQYLGQQPHTYAQAHVPPSVVSASGDVDEALYQLFLLQSIVESQKQQYRYAKHVYGAHVKASRARMPEGKQGGRAATDEDGAEAYDHYSRSLYGCAGNTGEMAADDDDSGHYTVRADVHSFRGKGATALPPSDLLSSLPSALSHSHARARVPSVPLYNGQSNAQARVQKYLRTGVNDYAGGLSSSLAEMASTEAGARGYQSRPGVYIQPKPLAIKATHEYSNAIANAIQSLTSVRENICNSTINNIGITTRAVSSKAMHVTSSHRHTDSNGKSDRNVSFAEPVVRSTLPRHVPARVNAATQSKLDAMIQQQLHEWRQLQLQLEGRMGGRGGEGGGETRPGVAYDIRGVMKTHSIAGSGMVRYTEMSDQVGSAYQNTSMSSSLSSSLPQRHMLSVRKHLEPAGRMGGGGVTGAYHPSPQALSTQAFRSSSLSSSAAVAATGVTSGGRHSASDHTRSKSYCEETDSQTIAHNDDNSHGNGNRDGKYSTSATQTDDNIKIDDGACARAGVSRKRGREISIYSKANALILPRSRSPSPDNSLLTTSRLARNPHIDHEQLKYFKLQEFASIAERDQMQAYDVPRHIELQQAPSYAHLSSGSDSNRNRNRNRESNGSRNRSRSNDRDKCGGRLTNKKKSTNSNLSFGVSKVKKVVNRKRTPMALVPAWHYTHKHIQKPYPPRR